jgi:hypothetical protein
MFDVFAKRVELDSNYLGAQSVGTQGIGDILTLHDQRYEEVTSMT